MDADSLEALRLTFWNPADPLKVLVQAFAVLGGVIGLVTALAKLGSWWQAKRDSQSLEKRVGADLYTPAQIQYARRYYIAPMCQSVDPAGAEEPRLAYAAKQKLFQALDDALMNPTEYRYLILLADSGMGKTSGLTNYYSRHRRRWRKKFDLVLIPLGIPDADERITAVQNKKDTVLFLDALDEDTLAIHNHTERLRTLVDLTREYQRVLISCRTQFFSKDEEIPKASGVIKITARPAGESAEYLFHKIYLSPFSDSQVRAYLRRRYPILKRSRRKRAESLVAKIPHQRLDLCFLPTSMT